MDDETTSLLPGRRSQEPINESARNSPEELSGCGATACCNPFKTFHRFVALIFMCFLSFGSYFCYDNPGALQDKIKADMKVDTFNFMLLYSLYSWPNTVLSFFGGFLIDRVFGIRLGAIIFAAFVMAGQVVFAMGALLNMYWVMLLGRFIFGIGGESLAVAQNTYAVSWFFGKELNMVFGIQLSFARIGSVVNFHAMEPLYTWMSNTYHNYTLLGVALMIAALTCVVSFLCAVILSILDKRAERLLQRQKGQSETLVKIKDVIYFPLSFWLLTVICVAYYVTIFPFIGLGNEFFMRKFDFSLSSANTVTSLVYTLSAVVSPVCGFLVDRTGRNIAWVLTAVLITLFSHGLLAFSFLNPYVAMTFMGISYSILASALWPMVSLVIPHHLLGTAYGVMQSGQNAGLAVFSMVAGMIVDSDGYLVLEVINVACLCVTLMVVVILWMVDLDRGGSLNLSVIERKRRALELEEDRNRLDTEGLIASGSLADVTPNDLLHCRSDFAMRNQYLSRLGARLPIHYDVSLSALAHRAGLK